MPRKILRNACRRRVAVAAMALVIGLPGTLASAQPKTPADPRQLLALAGLDDAFFSKFADGEPVSAEEEGKLLLLLMRLQQLPLSAVDRVARPPLAVTRIADEPASPRGQFYDLLAIAKRIERVELSPEDSQRLGFDAYYRCHLNALGAPVLLYTLHVPRHWPLDMAQEDRCGGPAMLLKELPADPTRAENEAATPDASPRLLFAAPRLAWYPDNLLGTLRMDASLLDDVRDRTGLDEAEAFYQLLTAVGRAADGYIERTARKQLAAERDELERRMQDPDVSPEDRAAAARALERGRDGASDVVPLFNAPAQQRGKLFILRGEALRAIKIQVDNPEIASRFHLNHYYEVELTTPDSQNNPIVCCVRSLPPGMPQGEAIREHVQVAGFFLKSWAFETQRSAAAADGEKRPRQLAPLLVAKTMELIPPPTVARPEQSIKLAAALGVVILLAGLAMWTIRRADRRALARLQAGRDALPPRVTLEETGGSGGSSADR